MDNITATVPKLYGCNSPFTLLDNTFPCIQIFTAKKTMQDAMIHCRSLGTDLFSTTSESWFNELATHLSTGEIYVYFYDQTIGCEYCNRTIV